MLFDFETFSRVVKGVYNPRSTYSLEEVLSVFHKYFQIYEGYMGRPHPPIKASQIARIIDDMPWLCEEEKGGKFESIDADYYSTLIEQHFKTRYRHCDYNINHFFSGRTREMRWYEVC